MARRSDRSRSDTEASGAYDTTCAACLSPDPQIRSAHQLAMARDVGLPGVRDHLHKYWAQQADPEVRRERIDSVCHWLGNLMTQWAGLVSEHTGAPLAWHEARQQVKRFTSQVPARPLHADPAPPAGMAPLREMVQRRIDGLPQAPPANEATWEDWPDEPEYSEDPDEGRVQAGEDPLAYSPEGDPEEAKRRARAQYRLLMEETEG